MKRDWDLLRKQLTELEEDRPFFKDILDKSKWPDITENEKEENARLKPPCSFVVFVPVVCYYMLKVNSHAVMRDIATNLWKYH